MECRTWATPPFAFEPALQTVSGQVTVRFTLASA